LVLLPLTMEGTDTGFDVPSGYIPISFGPLWAV
jgi:hypothetical protein